MTTLEATIDDRRGTAGCSHDKDSYDFKGPTFNLTSNNRSPCQRATSSRSLLQNVDYDKSFDLIKKQASITASQTELRMRSRDCFEKFRADASIHDGSVVSDTVPIVPLDRLFVKTLKKAASSDDLMMSTPLRQRSDHNNKFSSLSSRTNATIPQQEPQSTNPRRQIRSDFALSVETKKTEQFSSKDELVSMKLQKSESKKSLWNTLKNELKEISSASDHHSFAQTLSAKLENGIMKPESGGVSRPSIKSTKNESKRSLWSSIRFDTKDLNGTSEHCLTNKKTLPNKGDMACQDDAEQDQASSTEFGTGQPTSRHSMKTKTNSKRNLWNPLKFEKDDALNLNASFSSHLMKSESSLDNSLNFQSESDSKSKLKPAPKLSKSDVTKALWNALKSDPKQRQSEKNMNFELMSSDSDSNSIDEYGSENPDARENTDNLPRNNVSTTDSKFSSRKMVHEGSNLVKTSDSKFEDETNDIEAFIKSLPESSAETDRPSMRASRSTSKRLKRKSRKPDQRDFAHNKASTKEEEIDTETLIANLPLENSDEDKFVMRSSKHDSSKRSLRSSQKLDKDGRVDISKSDDIGVSVPTSTNNVTNTPTISEGYTSRGTKLRRCKNSSIAAKRANLHASLSELNFKSKDIPVNGLSKRSSVMSQTAMLNSCGNLKRRSHSSDPALILMSSVTVTPKNQMTLNQNTVFPLHAVAPKHASDGMTSNAVLSETNKSDLGNVPLSPIASFDNEVPQKAPETILLSDAVRYECRSVISNVTMVLVVRRPGCGACRELAQQISSLAIETESCAIGIVKPTDQEGTCLFDFFNDYFKHPIYADDQGKIFSLLGDRKITSLRYLSMRPKVNKRLVEKNIAHVTGLDAHIQGGVLIFDQRGELRHVFYEEYGDLFDDENVKEAVLDAKTASNRSMPRFSERKTHRERSVRDED